MPTRNSKAVTEPHMQEAEILEILQEMELNASYKTESTYSANAVLYPNHLISFREKHMAYLKSHPQLNPEHYLSNLRLMMRSRG